MYNMETREIKELLKPRYKVIADYPDSCLEVGEVLIVGENSDFMEPIEWWDKYPHLFKKLEWWEEREEKDMPKYLKSSLWVSKVIHYDLIAGLFRDEDYEKHGLETQLRTYLPATEEEYNQFLEGNNTQ